MNYIYIYKLVLSKSSSRTYHYVINSSGGASSGISPGFHASFNHILAFAETAPPCMSFASWVSAVEAAFGPLSCIFDVLLATAEFCDDTADEEKSELPNNGWVGSWFPNVPNGVLLVPSTPEFWLDHQKEFGRPKALVSGREGLIEEPVLSWLKLETDVGPLLLIEGAVELGIRNWVCWEVEVGRITYGLRSRLSNSVNLELSKFLSLSTIDCKLNPRLASSYATARNSS